MNEKCLMLHSNESREVCAFFAFRVQDVTIDQIHEYLKIWEKESAVSKDKRWSFIVWNPAR